MCIRNLSGNVKISRTFQNINVVNSSESKLFTASLYSLAHLKFICTMATKLTGKEFIEIKDGFNNIDSNKSGQISRTELRAAISQKRSNKEVDFIMRLMDKDQDDQIDFSEYMNIIAVLDYKKTPHAAQIKQMFRSLDEDNDGFVGAEEIKSLWNIFTDNIDIPKLDEIEDIMKALDSNKDGRIEYAEFAKKVNL